MGKENNSLKGFKGLKSFKDKRFRGSHLNTSLILNAPLGKLTDGVLLTKRRVLFVELKHLAKGLLC